MSTRLAAMQCLVHTAHSVCGILLLQVVKHSSRYNHVTSLRVTVCQVKILQDMDSVMTENGTVKYRQRSCAECCIPCSTCSVHICPAAAAPHTCSGTRRARTTLPALALAACKQVPRPTPHSCQNSYSQVNSADKAQTLVCTAVHASSQATAMHTFRHMLQLPTRVSSCHSAAAANSFKSVCWPNPADHQDHRQPPTSQQAEEHMGLVSQIVDSAELNTSSLLGTTCNSIYSVDNDTFRDAVQRCVMCYCCFAHPASWASFVHMLPLRTHMVLPVEQQGPPPPTTARTTTPCTCIACTSRPCTQSTKWRHRCC